MFLRQQGSPLAIIHVNYSKKRAGRLTRNGKMQAATLSPLQFARGCDTIDNMKTILLAVAAVATSTAAFSNPPDPKLAADWTVPKTFESAEGTLLYRWAEPEKTEPGKKYPLVVLLHGAGERGKNNVSQLQWGATPLLAYMREKGIAGYFIAGQVPNGQQWVDTPWNAAAHRMPQKPSASMALLLALIDKTIAEQPVDRARIYVTGVSMGGYGTWDAIQRRPDLFAAAMPICGGGDTHLAWKIRDIPIWVWHGSVDSAVPVSRSRDMVAALWSVDGRVRYSEVAGFDHAVWHPAYASTEALDWFFKQHK